jgi:two-component system CheB/CheR fusion protein
MRVLVVEDHLDSAKLFSRLLTLEGHTVDIAGDVHSALELCERNTYGVLLADIGLPDGSGLDLIQTLLRRCPVRGIAISGYAYDADIQKSLDAGFAEHLTKPIDARHLFAAIERVAALPLPTLPNSTMPDIPPWRNAHT